jgi:hypothetical protein
MPAEQAEDEARRAKPEAAKAEGKAPRGPDPKPPESGKALADDYELPTDEIEEAIRCELMIAAGPA